MIKWFNDLGDAAKAVIGFPIAIAGTILLGGIALLILNILWGFFLGD